MDIDLKGEGRYSSSRRLPYKYSIKSWKHWCEKNNAELFVLEDPLLPTNNMKICWQRYYLFDILEANEIEYNQIAMVDADTIVHPDCPNFFKSTENKFCAAEFDSSWDWVIRSIENYSLFSFDTSSPCSFTNFFGVLIFRSGKSLFNIGNSFTLSKRIQCNNVNSPP